jgi:CheY-like chemotaxis protein
VTTPLHPSSHHVVIVEDDGQIREMLAELLRDEGYQITAFATSDERTYQAIQRLRPDLVISDLLVPGAAGGMALLELIVADASLRHIPLIVCSASNDLQNAAARLNSPRVKPLAKPFDIDVLLDMVAAVLAGGAAAADPA